MENTQTQRIIIKVSSLSKESWRSIYSFIKEFNQVTLDNLREAKADLRITNSFLNRRVYSLYGEKITNIEQYDKSSILFSILYEKKDNNNNVLDLIPFFLLQKEIGNRISLGIDIRFLQDFNHLKGKSFYHKCSHFLQKVYIPKTIDGKDVVYFLTKEKPQGQSLVSNSSDESRNFLPLIKINEETFITLFQKEVSTEYKKEQSNLLSYIYSSIEKLKEKSTGKLKQILKKDSGNYRSSFERWLIYAYLFFFSKEEEISDDAFSKLKNILQRYYTSIFELVQNVIFHTDDKECLLSIAFINKKDVPFHYQDNLIDFFKVYNDKQRFLSVGVFDFNRKGIVETFKEQLSEEGKIDKQKEITLKDFFDTNSTTTTDLKHLELRYAAHLGIKAFVNNILKNDGYFRVESNLETLKVNNKTSLELSSNLIKINETKEKELSNFNGTHYECIFPVSSKNVKTVNSNFFRRDFSKGFNKEFSEILTDRINTIVEIDFPDTILGITSKEEQIKKIKEIGNNILLDIDKIEGEDVEIAIDMSKYSSDENNILFLLKLIAYLQFTSDRKIKTIILTHLKDEIINSICEQIQSLIIENKNILQVWNDDNALILISPKLRYQIISGSSKEKFLFLNREFDKYYFGGNYFNSNENTGKKHQINHKNKRNNSDSSFSFIRPYELIIINSTKKAFYLFEEAVSKLLQNPIIQQGGGVKDLEQGYLVNHEYTYIGSKIIVRSYYEADTLFQNSFYVQRFALIIIKQIQTKIKELKEKGLLKSNLVLIGYKYYSEHLVKEVKRLLTTTKECKRFNTIEDVIATEEKNRNDNDEIIFKTSEVKNNNGKSLKDKLRENIEEFNFITIVPIGSTLSTHDKMIAFFKQWWQELKTEQVENKKELDIIEEKSISLENNQFISNHCVIVARDKLKKQPTNIEKQEKWISINEEEKVISTKFNSAEKIYYAIQIANKDPKEDNWLARLNNKVSFPKKEWWKEKYVNYTENSSINSQNLMGFPKTVNSKKEIPYKKTQLKRLLQLKEDILEGHFTVYNSHYKHYIDTENFIKRKNKKEFDKWINFLQLKVGLQVNDIEQHILITPNAKIESDFINEVNNKVFDNKALIIYLDVHNWRNNVIHKLSHIKHLYQKNKNDGNNLIFHYIDHALITSETFKRTESYMFSILEDYKNFQFNTIITLVNRLSANKYEELKTRIKEKKNEHIYSFLDLNIPPIKDPEKDCNMCLLQNYYQKMSQHSVLETCQSVISKNKKKTNIIQMKRHNNSHNEEKLHFNRNQHTINQQKLIRMILIHELYDIISKKYKCNNPFSQQKEKVEKELDLFCDVLTKELKGEKKFFEFINNELYNNLLSPYNIQKITDKNEKQYDDIKEYLENLFLVDKKISFLKVISSPPLSQYIFIRDYAHKKLLDNLHELLDNKAGKEHAYNDIRLLKSILKSLSFLKSNALVRKEVIIGAWNLYFKVRNQIETEKKKLISLQDGISKTINLIDTQEYEKREEKKKIKLLQRLEKLGSQRNELQKYIKREIKKRNTEQSKVDKGLFDKSPNAPKTNKKIEDITKKIEQKTKAVKRITKRIEKITEVIEKITKAIENIPNKKEQYEKLKNRIKEDIKKLNNITVLDHEFNTDFQFYIKNLIFEDGTKSLFLGELLRTGHEIDFENTKEKSEREETDYKEISINKTELNNKLLSIFNNNKEEEANIYKEFLTWLFYDNTTIIRKTLNNFDNELKKDKKIKELFYSKDELRKIDDININTIKSKFNNKVKNEYYYNLFKYYIENGDRIDFTKKLIYVEYAKLKLMDLIKHKHKENIETDISSLIEVFSKIMGADGAFFAMKKANVQQKNKPKVYRISTYGLGNEQKDKIEKNNIINTGYYTAECYNDKEEYSQETILFEYNLPEVKTEKEILKAKSIVVFPIFTRIRIHENKNKSKKGKHKIKKVATITFLYNKDTNEDKFTIKAQESARLLLLLKNEIQDYIINFVKKDKVFDLWLEKEKNRRKFEKIYRDSSHVFKSVYNEMNEFDLLDNEDFNIIKYLHKTYCWLTNEVISFLYSNLEENQPNKENKTHYLTVEDDIIITKNTVEDIFNSNFIYILRVLKCSFWNIEDKDIQLFINNKDVDSYEIEEELKEEKIVLHKNLIRTFIIQCLNNSFNINKQPYNKGHRHPDEMKRVEIILSKKNIKIVDITTNKNNKQIKEYKDKKIKEFNRNRRHIKPLECEYYSSTTLSTLQAVIDWINKKDEYNMSCNYGYNDKENFEVEIIY